MKRAYGPSISLICLTLILTACATGSKEAKVIHVELTMSEFDMVGITHGFYLDEETVVTQMEKYRPVLPDPLPEGASVIYGSVGPFFGIMQKRAGEPGIRLTLDTNINHDLTDDETVEIPTVESWDEGVIVQITRRYETPEQHSAILPYRVSHQIREDRDGNTVDAVNIRANYIHEGTFHLNGNDYALKLVDGDTRGRFIKEKVVNVSISIGLESEMDVPGKTKSYRPFELATIEGRLYEFREIAEDGSWLELLESDLPAIYLGQAVPEMEMTDLEGQTFRLSDYLGKVLLLDFWPAWCKPCVAKFPDIKQMVETYADRPFAVIGINIDDDRLLEEAMKIIEEHDLNWRQVIEGKGEFIPSYQVLGRLPERAMSFPIYVLINEDGIAHYASNSYEKVERYLATHFSDRAEDRGVRFIPLTEQWAERSPVELPVDFTSEKVRILKEGPELKLPDNLPADTRIGMLPNGTALIAYPSAEDGRLLVIFDTERDLDLTNDEVRSVPVVTGTITEEEMVEMPLTIAYAHGAIGFRPVHMFARPASGGEAGTLPELFYRGMSMTFRGSFFEGRKEYEIALRDPTGDYLFVEEDMTDPTILTLRAREKGEWLTLYEGIESIPIGREKYRIRHISDDGQLIELEPSR